MDKFKHCNNCNASWNSLEDFICDKNVHLTGYQVNSNDPGKGLFLFIHDTRECQSTLAVKVEHINNYLHSDNPLIPFTPFKSHCPAYCVDQNNLNACQNKLCKGSTIRQMLQEILKKKAA